MIQKGTKEYKKAQQIANSLQDIASTERWNSNTLFNLYFNDFYNFINAVKEAGGFAAKICKTIDDKCNPTGFKIAYLSSKQAWILACSAVENNIEYSL